MFKCRFFILLIFFTVVTGETFATDKISVYVKIEGLRNSKGLCYLLLFKSKQGFPDSTKHAAIILKEPIINNTVEFEFETSSGILAISVLHDENLNEKLDKTWYGNPVEGFSVSNNPAIGFRPPRFQESSIILEEKTIFLNWT